MLSHKEIGGRLFRRVLTALFILAVFVFLPECSGGIVLKGDAGGEPGFDLSEYIPVDHAVEDIIPDAADMNETQELPLLTWARTYGTEDDQWISSIAQTPDGGYVVAGITEESIVGSWIIRLDPEGEVIWHKRYGDAGNHYIYSVQPLPDGGFVSAGTSIRPGEINFFYVSKLDGQGEVIWYRQYGRSTGDRANCIRLTEDRGYIVAGETWGHAESEADFWVLKLQPDGEISWQKAYGGPGYEDALSIGRTADGGFIVMGYSDSFGEGPEDIWVLKLDGEGNIMWQRIYGEPGIDEMGSSIHQTFDGGYIMAGGTGLLTELGPDIIVLKLGREGDVVWAKTYGTDYWDHARSVVQTGDGGYVVAGETYSFGAGDMDVWIVKMGGSGDILWQKTYGGTGEDRPGAVIETVDGGLAVAGSTCSFGAGERDFWVLKMDGEGSIAGGCPPGMIRNSSVEARNLPLEPLETTVSARDSDAVTTLLTYGVSDVNAVVEAQCR